MDAPGDIGGRERAQGEVRAALELATYVVETGVRDEQGQQLSAADLGAIQSAAIAMGLIGVAGSPPDAAPPLLSKDEWLAFEQAYYRVAIATSPVTAETLRNTRATSRDDEGFRGTLLWLWDGLRGFSPAQRFTRGLLYITIAFAIFVLAMETTINRLGMEADVEKVKVWKDLCSTLVPWGYGGLGACAYLLRSAHAYIYQRSFDLRRKPEYTNRILLGAISGGAIILYTDYLISQDDSYTHFGAAALGFIAGYSTDFLFNTIERIVTAIFPKVSVETVVKDDKSKTTKPTKPQKPGGTP